MRKHVFLEDFGVFITLYPEVTLHNYDICNNNHTCIKDQFKNP